MIPRSIIIVLCGLVVVGSAIPAYTQEKRESKRLEVTIYANPPRETGNSPGEVRRQPGTDRGGSSSDRSSGTGASNKAVTASRPALPRSTYLDDIVQPSLGSPGTFVGLSGAFTKKVLANNGQLPISVRATLGNRSSFMYIKKPGTSGHHYLVLNAIRQSVLDPVTVMTLIKQRPDRVFPWLDARGRFGREIWKGNTYSLTYSFVGYEVTNNQVEVTNVTPYTFTFTAKPGHKLRGSVTHGIFKDATGELWLFQEGTGVPGEDQSLQSFNYGLAGLMWASMAEKLRPYVTPSGKYKVRL